MLNQIKTNYEEISLRQTESGIPDGDAFAQITGIPFPFRTSNKGKLRWVARRATPGEIMEHRTDVLIIGGGPAGLAAAIAAVQKGFKVTVADGAKPPIDKVCGEGLMPNTLAALRELGVEISPRDGQVFRGIRFVDAT